MYLIVHEDIDGMVWERKFSENMRKSGEDDLSFYSRMLDEFTNLQDSVEPGWSDSNWYYPQIVIASEFNTQFQEYRDAVVMNHATGTPEHDIDGVKVIRLRRFREQREKLLQVLDEKEYIARRRGEVEEEANIWAVKEELCNIPDVMNDDFLAMTVDEVKAYKVPKSVKAVECQNKYGFKWPE